MSGRKGKKCRVEIAKMATHEKERGAVSHSERRYTYNYSEVREGRRDRGNFFRQRAVFKTIRSPDFWPEVLLSVKEMPSFPPLCLTALSFRPIIKEDLKVMKVAPSFYFWVATYPRFEAERKRKNFSRPACLHSLTSFSITIRNISYTDGKLRLCMEPFPMNFHSLSRSDSLYLIRRAESSFRNLSYARANGI